MQAFSAKGPSETLTLCVAFLNLLGQGETITAATVTADVFETSMAEDDTPSSIIAGAAQINAADIVIVGKTAAAGTVILQSVTGGVIGCTYVLTFQATTSSGEVLVEQATLYVAKYVPTP